MRCVAAAAAGTLLLAGCTALSPYAAPVDAPHAIVRIVANTLGGTATVVALETADCAAAAGRLIARLEERQPPDVRFVYLADGSPALAPSTEASVAADRPFHLLVQAQGKLDGWYGYVCAQAVTFLPAAGARYEAVYVSEDPYRCRIDVWRVAGAVRAAPEDLHRHPRPCAPRIYHE